MQEDIIKLQNFSVKEGIHKGKEEKKSHLQSLEDGYK